MESRTHLLPPTNWDPTTPIQSPRQSEIIYEAMNPSPKQEFADKTIKDARQKLETLIKTSNVNNQKDAEELLKEIINADCPLAMRYSALFDLPKLLKDNKTVKGGQSLQALSSALGILEKYGRNLIRPDRPSIWRAVRFSNGVFKSKVDIIKGARDVLKNYGYDQKIEDGLSFPADAQLPDIDRVTRLTADIVIAKYELEAFINGTHQHPGFLQMYLAATPSPAVPPRPPVSSGSQPNVVAPTTSSSSNYPSPSNYQPAATTTEDDHLCVLCGEASAALICDDEECGGARCEECDQRWHKHPKRKSHQTKPLFPPIYQAERPPLTSPKPSGVPFANVGAKTSSEHLDSFALNDPDTLRNMIKPAPPVASRPGTTYPPNSQSQQGAMPPSAAQGGDTGILYPPEEYEYMKDQRGPAAFPDAQRGAASPPTASDHRPGRDPNLGRPSGSVKQAAAQFNNPLADPAPPLHSPPPQPSTRASVADLQKQLATTGSNVQGTQPQLPPTRATVAHLQKQLATMPSIAPLSPPQQIPIRATVADLQKQLASANIAAQGPPNRSQKTMQSTPLVGLLAGSNMAKPDSQPPVTSGGQAPVSKMGGDQSQAAREPAVYYPAPGRPREQPFQASGAKQGDQYRATAVQPGDQYQATAVQPGDPYRATAVQPGDQYRANVEPSNQFQAPIAAGGQHQPPPKSIHDMSTAYRYMTPPAASTTHPHQASYTPATKTKPAPLATMTNAATRSPLASPHAVPKSARTPPSAGMGQAPSAQLVTPPSLTPSSLTVSHDGDFEKKKMQLEIKELEKKLELKKMREGLQAVGDMAGPLAVRQFTQQMAVLENEIIDIHKQYKQLLESQLSQPPSLPPSSPSFAQGNSDYAPVGPTTGYGGYGQRAPLSSGFTPSPPSSAGSTYPPGNAYHNPAAAAQPPMQQAPSGNYSQGPVHPFGVPARAAAPPTSSYPPRLPSGYSHRPPLQQFGPAAPPPGQPPPARRHPPPPPSAIPGVAHPVGKLSGHGGHPPNIPPQEQPPWGGGDGGGHPSPPKADIQAQPLARLGGSGSQEPLYEQIGEVGGPGPWPCDYCTFLNQDPHSRVCVVCHKTTTSIPPPPKRSPAVAAAAAPAPGPRDKAAAGPQELRSTPPPSPTPTQSSGCYSPGDKAIDYQHQVAREKAEAHREYEETLKREHAQKQALETGRMEPVKPSVQKAGQDGGISPEFLATHRPATGPQTGILQRSDLQEIQEKQMIEQLRVDGLEFINILRQSENSSYDLEELEAGFAQCNDGKPIEWLDANWKHYVKRVAEEATERGGIDHVGRITDSEAREALKKKRGDFENSVTYCINERVSKIFRIKTEFNCIPPDILKNLEEGNGDYDKAVDIIYQKTASKFLKTMWQTWEGRGRPESMYIQDQSERLVRLLLAEYDMSSWGRADTAAKLYLHNQNRLDHQRYQPEDVITATKECRGLDRAKQYLEKECEICFGQTPRNKLMSLSYCQCQMCLECLAGYFEVQIKDRHIMQTTCPVCDEPNLDDEATAAEYFSFLDNLFNEIIDRELYELYSKKLFDFYNMKDPNFRWCFHCTNGFIFEYPNQLKMQCPHCRRFTCFSCKKPWQDQHEGITCAQFEEWEFDNNPDVQAAGLAKYLEKSGIDCPNCNFRYALAKGGCMHFTCTQCRHEFCCGCNHPFKHKCNMLASCKNKGLHAHHPRDCLFYLRDLDVKRLQELLRNHEVEYDTETPAEATRRCQVGEQKEMPNEDGLSDDICGRDVPQGFAGLCSVHYKEYLVYLINRNGIDPAETYEIHELVTVLGRTHSEKLPRLPNESDNEFRLKALQVVKKLPLTKRTGRIPTGANANP